MTRGFGFSIVAQCNAVPPWPGVSSRATRSDPASCKYLITEGLGFRRAAAGRGAFPRPRERGGCAPCSGRSAPCAWGTLPLQCPARVNPQEGRENVPHVSGLGQIVSSGWAWLAEVAQRLRPGIRPTRRVRVVPVEGEKTRNAPDRQAEPVMRYIFATGRRAAAQLTDLA